MRKARIHIYFGTTLLPKRELQDQETGHDVIEVDIGPNENVMQLDLEKQPGVYHRRLETDAEVQRRLDMAPGNRQIVAELGGTYTGDERPAPKMINERLKNMESFRYRIVTLEQVDALALDTAVEDATVIDDVGPACAIWTDQFCGSPEKCFKGDRYTGCTRSVVMDSAD